MSAGLFITFEGIDGSGKSTQLARAARYLADQGISIEVTREPGGTKIGETIREILISPENAEMDDTCEALLYMAARAQHVREKIAPAVGGGAVVLCDRFQEATFAYQGYGRGFDIKRIRELNSFATRGLNPDLTLIFDIRLECATRRMRAMGKAPDRLEQLSSEFFEKVRQGYLRQAEASPERMAVIDAEDSVESVWNVVRGELDRLVRTRGAQRRAAGQ
jgi:dTMP kinase